MAKKHDTVLTDVAGKIGSTLGIIAAEAAKGCATSESEASKAFAFTGSCSSPQETRDSFRPFYAAAYKRAQTDEAE